jgi:hypothetical protein
MIRISYVSTAKLGTIDSDLAELMPVAAKRNAAPSIRGYWATTTGISFRR